MAAWTDDPAADGAALVAAAARLRWSAPELAVQFAACAIDHGVGPEERLTCQSLLAAGLTALGRPAEAVEPAVAALRFATATGRAEEVTALRTTLATCARTLGDPLTGSEILRPALTDPPSATTSQEATLRPHPADRAPSSGWPPTGTPQAGSPGSTPTGQGPSSGWSPSGTSQGFALGSYPADAGGAPQPGHSQVGHPLPDLLVPVAAGNPAGPEAAVSPTTTARAMVELASCLSHVAGRDDVEDAFTEADRLISADEALSPARRRVERAMVCAHTAAYHRRYGDTEAAADSANEGLAILRHPDGADPDPSGVRAALVHELTLALLDEGALDEAIAASAPLLAEPVRATTAPAVSRLRLAVATRVHLPAGRTDLGRTLLLDTIDTATRHTLESTLADAWTFLAHIEESAAHPVAALHALRSARAAEHRHHRTTTRARRLLTTEFTPTTNPTQGAALLNTVVQPHAPTIPLTTHSRRPSPPQGTVSSSGDTPTSPQGALPSPQDTPSSPHGAFASPQEAPSSPREAPASPEGTLFSSQGTYASPGGALSSPEGTPFSPQGAPASPEGTLASPQDTPAPLHPPPPSPHASHPTTADPSPFTPSPPTTPRAKSPNPLDPPDPEPLNPSVSPHPESPSFASPHRESSDSVGVAGSLGRLGFEPGISGEAGDLSAEPPVADAGESAGEVPRGRSIPFGSSAGRFFGGAGGEAAASGGGVGVPGWGGVEHRHDPVERVPSGPEGPGAEKEMSSVGRHEAPDGPSEAREDGGFTLILVRVEPIGHPEAVDPEEPALPVGDDAMINALASRVRDLAPTGTDLVRCDRGEFAVLLPRTPTVIAEQFASIIRKQAGRGPWLADVVGRPVTVRTAVANHVAVGVTRGLDTLLQVARAVLRGEPVNPLAERSQPAAPLAKRSQPVDSFAERSLDPLAERSLPVDSFAERSLDPLAGRSQPVDSLVERLPVDPAAGRNLPVEQPQPRDQEQRPSRRDRRAAAPSDAHEVLSRFGITAAGGGRRRAPDDDLNPYLTIGPAHSRSTQPDNRTSDRLPPTQTNHPTTPDPADIPPAQGTHSALPAGADAPPVWGSHSATSGSGDVPSARTGHSAVPAPADVPPVGTDHSPTPELADIPQARGSRSAVPESGDIPQARGSRSAAPESGDIPQAWGRRSAAPESGDGSSGRAGHSADSGPGDVPPVGTGDSAASEPAGAPLVWGSHTAASESAETPPARGRRSADTSPARASHPAVPEPGEIPPVEPAPDEIPPIEPGPDQVPTREPGAIPVPPKPAEIPPMRPEPAEIPPAQPDSDDAPSAASLLDRLSKLVSGEPEPSTVDKPVKRRDSAVIPRPTPAMAEWLRRAGRPLPEDDLLEPVEDTPQPPAAEPEQAEPEQADKTDRPRRRERSSSDLANLLAEALAAFQATQADDPERPSLPAARHPEPDPGGPARLPTRPDDARPAFPAARSGDEAADQHRAVPTSRSEGERPSPLDAALAARRPIPDTGGRRRAPEDPPGTGRRAARRAREEAGPSWAADARAADPDSPPPSRGLAWRPEEGGRHRSSGWAPADIDGG
ncbi:hypothetical protein [Actinokineospora sp. NPDC004072]